eukprot:6540564-Prorocentrum_lima.AAC.1
MDVSIRSHFGSSLCGAVEVMASEAEAVAHGLLRCLVAAGASRHSIATATVALFRILLGLEEDGQQLNSEVEERLAMVRPGLVQQVAAKQHLQQVGRLPGIATGSLRRQRNHALHAASWPSVDSRA